MLGTLLGSSIETDPVQCTVCQLKEEKTIELQLLSPSKVALRDITLEPTTNASSTVHVRVHLATVMCYIHVLQSAVSQKAVKGKMGKDRLAARREAFGLVWKL